VPRAQCLAIPWLPGRNERDSRIRREHQKFHRSASYPVRSVNLLHMAKSPDDQPDPHRARAAEMVAFLKKAFEGKSDTENFLDLVRMQDEDEPAEQGRE